MMMMMMMMMNSFVGYESDHLSYGSLPRQCVSPWYDYASDTEGRRFNSLGRCDTVFGFHCVVFFELTTLC